MKQVVAIFLMLLSLSCYGDTWIHTGMLSKHFTGGEYNERHNLIGIEHDQWYVGYYNNSFNDDSFFLFRTYRWKPVFTNIKFGWKYGAISGYDNGIEMFGTEVTPAFIPTLFFDYEPVSIDFNMLGSIYSVEFKFKL